MARKKQGYNARLDESLGERNRGKKTQSLKSRRDESKGTEKAMGKRAYSAVSTMDKGSRKKKAAPKRAVNLGAGGPVTKARKMGGGKNSSDTSQHKRMAMGEKVQQGNKPVKLRGGGAAMKKMKRGGGPVMLRGGGAAMKKMKRGGAPGSRKR